MCVRCVLACLSDLITGMERNSVFSIKAATTFLHTQQIFGVIDRNLSRVVIKITSMFLHCNETPLDFSSEVCKDH